MSTLQQEFLLTLNLFRNQFDPDDNSEDRPRKKMYEELLSFGEDISIKALKQYRLSTQSPFLSYPEIINCVKNQMAKQENLFDAKTAWGKLQDAINLYGASEPKDMPLILKQTVHALGGWNHLRRSENTMSDRSNFYRIYDEYYNEYLTNLLLN